MDEKYIPAHQLKTWPSYFCATWAGDKNFEVRKDDRGFQKGDSVILSEFKPESGLFTGRRIHAKISYVLHGARWGIAEEYCVFGVVDQMNVDEAN